MGLNDSFILDDSAETPPPTIKVDALKDTLPGQDPELNDNVTLIGVNEQDAKELDEQHQQSIVALEQLTIELADIAYIGQTLKVTKGISQSIATECLHVLPNLINDERPLGSFTKQVTQINYTAALEEVDEKQKGVLAKIKEIISKIITSISDFIKRVFGGDKAKKYKDVADKAQEMTQPGVTEFDWAKAAKQAAIEITPAPKKQEPVEASKPAPSAQEKPEPKPEPVKVVEEEEISANDRKEILDFQRKRIESVFVTEHNKLGYLVVIGHHNDHQNRDIAMQAIKAMARPDFFDAGKLSDDRVTEIEKSIDKIEYMVTAYSTDKNKFLDQIIESISTNNQHFFKTRQDYLVYYELIELYADMGDAADAAKKSLDKIEDEQELKNLRQRLDLYKKVSRIIYFFVNAGSSYFVELSQIRRFIRKKGEDEQNYTRPANEEYALTLKELRGITAALEESDHGSVAVVDRTKEFLVKLLERFAEVIARFFGKKSFEDHQNLAAKAQTLHDAPINWIAMAKKTGVEPEQPKADDNVQDVEVKQAAAEAKANPSDDQKKKMIGMYRSMLERDYKSGDRILYLVLLAHKRYGQESEELEKAFATVMDVKFFTEKSEDDSTFERITTSIEDLNKKIASIKEDEATFFDQLMSTFMVEERYFFADKSVYERHLRFVKSYQMFSRNVETIRGLVKKAQTAEDTAFLQQRFKVAAALLQKMYSIMNAGTAFFNDFIFVHQGNNRQDGFEYVEKKYVANEGLVDLALMELAAAQEEFGALDNSTAQLHAALESIVATATIATPVKFAPRLRTSFLQTALEEDSSGEQEQKQAAEDVPKKRNAIVEWIKKMVEHIAAVFKKYFTKDNVAQLEHSAKAVESASASSVNLLALAHAAKVELSDDEKENQQAAIRKVEQDFKKTLGDKFGDANLRLLFVIGSDKFGNHTHNLLENYKTVNKSLQNILSNPSGTAEMVSRAKATVDLFRKQVMEPVNNRDALLDELFENIIVSKRTLFMNKGVTQGIIDAVGQSSAVTKFLEEAKKFVSTKDWEDTVRVQAAVTTLNAYISEVSRISNMFNKYASLLASFATSKESAASGKPATESFSAAAPSMSTSGLMLEKPLAQLYESPLMNEQGGYAAAGMQYPAPAGYAEYYVNPPVVDAVIGNAGSGTPVVVSPVTELTARIRTLQEALARVTEGQEPSMEAMELLTAELMPKQSIKLMTSFDNKKIDKELFAEALNQSMSLVNKDLAAFTASGTFSSGLARDLAKVTSKNFIFGAKPREATLDDVAAVKRKLNAEAAGILAGVGSSKTFSSVLDSIAAFGVFVKADIFSSSAFWTSVGQYDKKRRIMLNNYDVEFVENYDEAVEIILKGILGQDKSFFKDHAYAYGKIIELLDQAGYFVETKLKKYIQIAEDKGYEKDLAYFNEVNRVYEIAINDMIYAGRCIWFYTETKKEVLG